MIWPPPSRSLEGLIVVLEPIREDHREGLFAASLDPETWTWIDRRVPGNRGEFDAWFDLQLALECVRIAAICVDRLRAIVHLKVETQESDMGRLIQRIVTDDAFLPCDGFMDPTIVRREFGEGIGCLDELPEQGFAAQFDPLAAHAR